jgi:hypothetical protein
MQARHICVSSMVAEASKLMSCIDGHCATAQQLTLHNRLRVRYMTGPAALSAHETPVRSHITIYLSNSPFELSWRLLGVTVQHRSPVDRRSQSTACCSSPWQLITSSHPANMHKQLLFDVPNMHVVARVCTVWLAASAAVRQCCSVE